jgi:hypothetical protein
MLSFKSSPSITSRFDVDDEVSAFAFVDYVNSRPLAAPKFF